MNRIFVASDLSIRCDRAVGRAVRIAAHLNVGLTTLNVVDSAMPTDLAEMAKTKAKTSLERVVASQPGSKNVDVKVICVIGDPVQVIHDTARETHADLLILGAHLFRSFFDSVRETTMEQLVRVSAKPTLLVADTSDHDYAKVLAAVDMSPACTKAISSAYQLVPSAVFSLFHGLHIPFKGLIGDADTAAKMLPYVKETESEIDEWISVSAFPVSTPRPNIIQGGLTAALKKSMSQSRPDLLVLGANSCTGLGRWILGSLTTDPIRDPPCDLLVAR